jgi:hypothetical protein
LRFGLALPATSSGRAGDAPRSPCVDLIGLVGRSSGVTSWMSPRANDPSSYDP